MNECWWGPDLCRPCAGNCRSCDFMSIIPRTRQFMALHCILWLLHSCFLLFYFVPRALEGLIWVSHRGKNINNSVVTWGALSFCVNCRSLQTEASWPGLKRLLAVPTGSDQALELHYPVTNVCSVLVYQQWLGQKAQLSYWRGGDRCTLTAAPVFGTGRTLASKKRFFFHPHTLLNLSIVLPKPLRNFAFVWPSLLTSQQTHFYFLNIHF